MKNIPKTENALVLRTDFTDESAWESLCRDIEEPVGEFKADVEFVSDPEFAGLDARQLPAAASEDPLRGFAFLVDHVALSHPDQPILVVDLQDEPGRSFRVIPSEMWSVENNLSLANMGFEEFADEVDADGIFRGFP
jgi:hypothetical protein